MRDGDATIDLANLGETLSYATGRTASRRRGFRMRHVVAVATLAAAVAGSWGLGRVARDRAQAYLYEQQASTRVEPSDRVVFDADRDRAHALAAGPLYERLHVTGLPDVLPREAPAVRPEPPELQALRRSLAEAGESGDPAVDQAPLLFLHELTSASGARRIVAIRFLPWVVGEDSAFNPGGPAGLVAQVLEPGGFFGRARHVGTSRAPLLLESGRGDADDGPYALVADAGLRWYAGQPDRADPAHFTLAFEVAGKPGTVDGFLSADGSVVRMDIRAES